MGAGWRGAQKGVSCGGRWLAWGVERRKLSRALDGAGVILKPVVERGVSHSDCPIAWSAGAREAYAVTGTVLCGERGEQEGGSV